MSKLLRLSLVSSAIFGALVAVNAARPGLAASCGVDWWNLADLEKGIQEDLRHQEELDAKFETALQRLAGRKTVVTELVAGRMTLLEAAVQFRRLSKTNPERGPSYDNTYSGKSEGERLCRYVIRWVRIELAERTPSMAETQVERLERDLQTLLQEDGMVHLPRNKSSHRSREAHPLRRVGFFCCANEEPHPSVLSLAPLGWGRGG